MINTERDARQLRQIMVWGSAIGGGALAGTLQAFRPPMTLEVSWWTLLAFIMGLGFFVGYWKLIFAERKGGWNKVGLVIMTLILVAAGAAGVLYPLRFVSHAVLPDLIFGLIAAVCALSGVALLLLGARRLFESD